MAESITYRKLMLFKTPGESDRQFAMRFGILPNTLSYWKRSIPDPAWLLKLSEIFDKPVDWFLKEGEAPPLVSGDVSLEIDPSPVDDYALIPQYEVQLSAGGGAYVLGEEVSGLCAFRREWLKQTGTKEGGLRLFPVRGDSMSPTLMEGDLVLVDTNRKTLKNNGIYAIREDDLVSIKRLHTKGATQVLILSDNAGEYPSRTAKKQEFEILGQMIWSARTWV